MGWQATTSSFLSDTAAFSVKRMMRLRFVQIRLERAQPLISSNSTH